MDLSLATYVHAAKRSILLACAPLSVSPILNSMEKHCGRPVNVFYWPNKERKGTLLVEVESAARLNVCLNNLPEFSRVIHNFPAKEHSIVRRLKLNTFRLCSDPSCWRVSRPPLLATNLYPPNVDVQKPLVDTRALKIRLQSCDSIDDQASLLFNTNCLTYPELLARFTVCDSVQDVLSQIYRDTQVSVFGSVVDGLGSATSDLDLVIRLGSDVNPELVDIMDRTNLKHNGPAPNTGVSIIPALLAPPHSKHMFLSALRNLLVRLDPLGFTGAKVYRGRVPILHLKKFNLLGVGIDISRVSNTSSQSEKIHFHDGIHLTQLLRAVNCCVPGFAKCIVVLKFISRRAGLTREGPSPGFTNFKLTMLFVHFLQAYGYAPPFKLLHHIASDSSHSLSTLTDLISLPSVDTLFQQFFAYITTLHPSHVVLDLCTGRAIPRDLTTSSVPATLDDVETSEGEPKVCDSGYVLCPNPIHPNQNILHGVDETDWSNLVELCHQWAQALEYNPRPLTGSTGSDWGLLALRKPDSDSDTSVSACHSIRC
ncbi:hypothetical protein CRM22_009858 [Opisthorchis felineus]|uniref:Poly(A) RNA polymerase mitochondrial-like central palm domain-containing protein n=1 Tax=Opisthorchis felineus TaxID=147828 RepID=A0A4S2L4W9_OPIFE|nr:hypothetical protein CRM22_009858 [Opisthorchis felineus]